MARERIYLDNAATSWPKPASVVEAVQHHMTELGACAGRSGYREANEVERLIGDTRKQIAYLFGTHSPEHVIFGYNGTDMLNLALHGLLQRGDHVVTTSVEHNSILRPISTMMQTLELDVTYVEPGEDGRVDPHDVGNAIMDNTRLIAITHVSNVTGAIQPIQEICAIAKDRGVRTLVDAAQSAGHLDLNLAETPIDMVAFPGHKGLLGPLGTGAMILQPEVAGELKSQRQGGTGTKSESNEQPIELPTKFESGNANVPGILGLRAGVEYIREQTVTALHRHTMQNTSRLIEGLQGMPKVRIFGPQNLEQRTGVVSIQVESFDPHELATALDSAFGVQCRAGLHCAPLMHQHLGTIGHGGTLRFSLSIFTTAEQIDRTLEAMQAILR
ncbi:aminotransferase class V-fold PLP-dependent enzyme [Bremerella sp. T1]|uniref:aminotransferase class V-fold PLP-dependent enzyme n=1 Tax=Bremerella sp. TYQ1 TaxID=3119568 RepID=UPI001CCF529B|nr:aminotransferase class V-fold PLP-dependent enzyme [Bremerella volcania]UBM36298.1 aminotransferase class V-fold PLP-dependent enzyme [Bremerella volcania]